MWERESAAVES